mmetsp:Transcript_22745/g.73152  ORF Transcript_22745/g.73152 Transcript_22745/m.73152 type:complete len:202 (-) Transcript_22745:621-1226(-)
MDEGREEESHEGVGGGGPDGDEVGEAPATGVGLGDEVVFVVFERGEVLRGEVRLDIRGLGRLGDDDDAAVEVPPKGDVELGPAPHTRDGEEAGVVAYGRPRFGEGAPRDRRHPGFQAELHELCVLAQGVALELVRPAPEVRRRLLGPGGPYLAEEVGELRDVEVRDAETLDFPLLHEAPQGRPGVLREVDGVRNQKSSGLP